MGKLSQNDLISRYMSAPSRPGLTALQALDKFGTMRLAARISDLRGLGHRIVNHPYVTDSGKRIARYYLE